MDARELEYDLPPELIAQHPAARRDDSRLLVHDRSTGRTEHRVFRELPQLVDALAVVNDTRVVPARIPINEPRGEVLLLEQVDGDVWEALARPTRRLRAGERYGEVELIEDLGGGRWRRRLGGGARRGPPPSPRPSPSRSPTPPATRRSTRASAARPRRRPRGCTSLPDRK